MPRRRRPGTNTGSRCRSRTAERLVHTCHLSRSRDSGHTPEVRRPRVYALDNRSREPGERKCSGGRWHRRHARPPPRGTRHASRAASQRRRGTARRRELESERGHAPEARRGFPRAAGRLPTPRVAGRAARPSGRAGRAAARDPCRARFFSEINNQVKNPTDPPVRTTDALNVPPAIYSLDSSPHAHVTTREKGQAVHLWPVPVPTLLARRPSGRLAPFAQHPLRAIMRRGDTRLE